MDEFLSRKINKFLDSQDYDAAFQTIKDAISLGYPYELINSWKLRLDQLDSVQRHPLELAQKPVDINYKQSCQLGPKLKKEFRANIERYFTENRINNRSLDKIVDLVFNSLDQLSGSVLVPDLTSNNPCENIIRYTVDQYISESPDIFDGVNRGNILSEMDHFLRCGYIEIMKGTRYSSISLKHERKIYRGRMLYIVDNYCQLSKEEIDDLHSLQLDNLAADIFSVSHYSVYTSAGLCIKAENYLYQHISEDQNLCILLKNKKLTSSANKWLIDIKLKDRMAVFGYSRNNGILSSSVEPSQVNMLISDATNGCIIVNAIEVLSVFGELKGYQTAYGFYHSLVLALQYSGIDLCLKSEILSETTSIYSKNSISNVSYWSPFYWSSPGRSSDKSLSKSIRSDFVKTWSNYLENTSNKLNCDRAEFNLEVDIENLVVRHRTTLNCTIAVIIPFKDKIHLLKNCVESLMSKKEEVGFTIYAINNDSCQENTFHVLRSLEKKYPNSFKNIDSPGEFNFSKINNEAVNFVSEEYLLFLNNDIVFDSDYPLTTLIRSHYFHNAIITGSKLLYSSGKIQHNGLAISTQKHIAILSPFRGEKAHLNYIESLDRSDLHPWERTHECSAVTAACMLIKKEEFLSIGGFDENLQISYNDVDLCFRAKEKFSGRPIICSTEAKILHLESESRGFDTNPGKRARLYREKTYLVDRHIHLFSTCDRFLGFNPPSDDIRRYIKTNIDRKYAQSLPYSLSSISLDVLYSNRCFQDKKRDYACVFVHYDKDALVPADCIYHIQKLSEYCDVYFVSSSEDLASKPDEIRKVIPFCKNILVRKNSGYDFGCWSHVIRDKYQDLCTYDGVLLCNDSNWGPLHDFKDTFSKVRQLSQEADFFGLTSSIMPTWHLQSFFILYSKNVFCSSYFKQHWFNIGIFKSKLEIILNYEVNWCSSLARLGFQGVALYGDASANNPTHNDWKSLIQINYPYLKKELLRDNPLKMDLRQIPTILSAYNENWCQHILDYLKRYGKGKSDIANLLQDL